jgi:hypothetical protein
LRVRRQASRKRASTGQGADRLRHCIQPEPAIASPAKANSPSLCSESQATCGKTETSDDKAAPAPSATRSAGIAQQTSVLDVANRLATELHKLPRA